MPQSIAIKDALNQAYRKQKVRKSDLEHFTTQLSQLLQRVKHSEERKESEENFKNLLSDFLKDTYYKDRHEINTYGRTDLVIHTDKSAKSSVGVLLEVKRPGNKVDMVSPENLDAKAMHELLLYYFRQKDQENNDIKYCIITNIYEWYIFDAAEFFREFDKDKALKKEYYAWKNRQKESNHTDYFYQHIASPAVAAKQANLSYTYLKLQDYEKPLAKVNQAESRKLVMLYKLFSPEHLLKQSFVNDSNSLDRKFYNELLHIIGLSEVKEKGKKLIERKAEGERDSGSILENTISVLKAENRVYRLREADKYGSEDEERHFNVALELTITWLNRILFLKLLEAQLINYHDSKAYAFLNREKIHDFDDLNSLFFKVLAQQTENRSPNVKQYFGMVPYLNSSLFEPTELEYDTIFISNLEDRFELPVYRQTVLKDAQGKMLKDTRYSTLEYLFRFLDAYDFSSEGGEEVQEENKALINASVLGLIFEKINGYKDGSFFTPGFITMYMSRETIRKAVVQKFNQAFQIDCAGFEELQNFASSRNYKTDFIRQGNALINSLTICDPAVGSGHFLVSALNEILAIKSELGILADQKQQALPVRVAVVNDELMVTNPQGDFFAYRPGQSESQRIQESLFHEKETLIESCLFGVDINENSVKICRLRLWIELLKNAYYTVESDYKELETLPNIDINIKAGNSLLYRFSLQEDLSDVFKKQKFSLQTYKDTVQAYKSTHSKEAKRELMAFLREIKEQFRTSLTNRDPLRKKMSKLRGEVEIMENPSDLFGDVKVDKKLLARKKKELAKLEQEKADIESNKLYEGAFEWRFEFPEVLDAQGDFVGFDVVIGNPPYIPLEVFNESIKHYFRSNYPLVERKYDTSVLFIILGLKLLNEKSLLSYIAPVTWQTGDNYSQLRKKLFNDWGIEKIVNLPFDIFMDAYVDTAVYILSNKPESHYDIYSFGKKEYHSELNEINFKTINKNLIQEPKYKLILNPEVFALIRRLDKTKFESFGNISRSTQGLSPSRFPKVNDLDRDHIFPYLEKGNVYNYSLIVEKTYFTTLEENESLIPYYGDNEKILIRRIINRQDRLTVGFTDKKLVFKKDINPFIIESEDFLTKYVLTILASRFISYYYINVSSIALKDDFRQTTLTELREIPIPTIPLKDQLPLVDIANQILTTKAQNPSADTTALEAEIDQLVYQLYGLTEEEIKIIEDSVSS